MTPDVRTEFLRRLALGQSPQFVCHSLHVEPAEFFATAHGDVEFARAMEQAQSLKSRNVESLLYRKALEGNVPAMTQYLKLAPPPEWNGETRPSDANDLSTMTLAELRDVAESLRDVTSRVAERDSTPSKLSEASPSDEPGDLPKADSAA